MMTFFLLGLAFGSSLLIKILLFWDVTPWPKTALKLPRYQAHRGDWKAKGLQENTLAAFQSAKAAGIEMVELDVQLSKDNEVVVFHDYDLKRLGRTQDRVRMLTAKQLNELVKAPLLRDVLSASDVASMINIEIKSNEFGNGILERKVAEVVKETNSEDRVLFSSFNPFVLGRLKKLLPDVPRALIVTEERDSSNKLWLRKILLGAYASPHLLHLNEKMLTPERIKGWSKRGIPVVAWTVNDPQKAKQYLEWGAVGIITDDVTMIRQ